MTKEYVVLTDSGNYYTLTIKGTIHKTIYIDYKDEERLVVSATPEGNRNDMVKQCMEDNIVRRKVKISDIKKGVVIWHVVESERDNATAGHTTKIEKLFRRII